MHNNMIEIVLMLIIFVQAVNNFATKFRMDDLEDRVIDLELLAFDKKEDDGR